MRPDTSPRPNVFLLTGPIQTGKTTRLRAWCASQLADRVIGGGNQIAVVDGILAPVVDGRRHLLHIGSGEIRNLEDLPVGAPAVTVRRFTFNESVFAWARERLLDAGRAAVSRAAAAPGGGSGEPFGDGPVAPPWIVVDEVGPLELDGGGLEPAVSQLLDLRREGGNGVTIFRLALVVREGIVGEALDHFRLSTAEVSPFPHA